MDNNFGERLKQRREAASIKVPDAAKALRVDRKQIYRYENGEQFPDYQKLKELSLLYKCDLFRDLSDIFGLGAGTQVPGLAVTYEKYVGVLEELVDKQKEIDLLKKQLEQYKAIQEAIDNIPSSADPSGTGEDAAANRGKHSDPKLARGTVKPPTSVHKKAGQGRSQKQGK